MRCNRMDHIRVDRRNHREISYAGPRPRGIYHYNFTRYCRCSRGRVLGPLPGTLWRRRSGRIHNGSPGIDRITLDLSNGVASRMI